MNTGETSRYFGDTRHKRKIFSHSQRIMLAAAQNYMCPGKLCNNLKLLPATWELDHKTPLFLGGTNNMDNLWLLCPNCHAEKTQNERVNYAFQARNTSSDSSVAIPDILTKLNRIEQSQDELIKLLFGGRSIKPEPNNRNSNRNIYFDHSGRRYIVKYAHNQKIKRKSFGCGRYNSKVNAKLAADMWLSQKTN